MNSIINIKLPEKCRILAVSDIHTAWQTLEGLLNKADFSCSLQPVYVDWTHQDMVILDEMGYVTKIRDNISGIEGYFPKREIYEFDGKPHVYQFLSSFPAVNKGETVSICAEDGTMTLVITENAVVGWIPSEIIDK